MARDIAHLGRVGRRRKGRGGAGAPRSEMTMPTLGPHNPYARSRRRNGLVEDVLAAQPEARADDPVETGIRTRRAEIGREPFPFSPGRAPSRRRRPRRCSSRESTA